MSSDRPGRARALAVLPLLVIPAVLLGAGAVLVHQLRGYPWDRLGPELAAIGPGPLGLAAAATALSYLAMTGYDALALRYVQHRLPYPRYAAASFVATAFGNSLGASAVVGAALRARVYSAWGVPGFAITRIIGFNLVTLCLGSTLLAGVGLVVDGERSAAALRLPAPAAIALGVLLLGSVSGYLLWSGADRPALGVRSWRVDRPSRPLAVAQLALSAVEWSLMAAVLYALLPDGAAVGFAPFVTVFVLATVAGLASNVPGGLGVFEAVLLLGLGGALEPAQLVATLVAYRFVYYLVPLALAAGLLAVLESQRDRALFGGLVERVGVLTPSVLALACAGLGTVLVLTGDVPGDSRAPDLTTFTSSLAGLGLLLLSRGLHRRLRGALLISIGLLTTIFVAAATHRALGLAAVAAVVLVLLVLARAAFHRTTSVLRDPRGWAWGAAMAVLATGLVTWHDLWSGGRLIGDEPLLRAAASDGTSSGVQVGLSLGLAAVLVAGVRLQAPRLTTPATAELHELHRAEPVLATASHGNASLLWCGDKRLMFSAEGGALLMYQVEGRSWVVMGDPVGDPTQYDDLIWRFRDLCDAHLGRPVFYSVREDVADLYRRHGLSLVKLGEEAVVPLSGFSLAGKGRGKLRSECNASRRAGCEVAVLAPQEVASVLPELREVSDAWLVERNAREKGFSLGAFDEEYVQRFPVAVARLDGRVVAFATLWASGGRHEVKVDLMRRVADAPRTVMSHLFVECMLWAQSEGYQAFSLGMAPLSGLRTEGATTFWDRIGHFVWTHGEHFYNFQGLRQFKERFDPDWQPRYVASPGGPGLPLMMLNVATLVGGGLRGVVTR